MIITHEAIAERARRIWEKEGRPEGRDQEHWLQAEAELRQETMQDQNGRSLTSEDPAMLQVPGDLKGGNASRKRSVRRR